MLAEHLNTLVRTEVMGKTARMRIDKSGGSVIYNSQHGIFCLNTIPCMVRSWHSANTTHGLGLPKLACGRNRPQQRL